MVSFNLAREKPKVVKGSGEANDGPEAKKPKVDPNETTMVKKVGVNNEFFICTFNVLKCSLWLSLYRRSVFAVWKRPWRLTGLMRKLKAIWNVFLQTTSFSKVQVHSILKIITDKSYFLCLLQIKFLLFTFYLIIIKHINLSLPNNIFSQPDVCNCNCPMVRIPTFNKMNPRPTFHFQAGILRKTPSQLPSHVDFIFVKWLIY